MGKFIPDSDLLSLVWVAPEPDTIGILGTATSATSSMADIQHFDAETHPFVSEITQAPQLECDLIDAGAGFYADWDITAGELGMSVDGLYAFVFEFDTDDTLAILDWGELQFYFVFIPTTGGWSDRTSFSISGAGPKKRKRMYVPFKANSAEMSSPGHATPILTDYGVAMDWVNFTGKVRMYVQGTSDSQQFADFAHLRFIGLGEYTNPITYCMLSYDDNYISQYVNGGNGVFEQAKTHDVPFCLFLLGDRLPGGSLYTANPSDYCSEAQLLEMKNEKRADGVKRLVTMASHSQKHEALGSRYWHDIKFTAPDQILSTEIALDNFYVGSKIVIEGTDNNDGEYTIESRTAAAITTVENTITTEDNSAATPKRFTIIKRDREEMLNQLNDVKPALAQYWSGVAPMHSHPFGSENTESLQLAQDEGYVLQRDAGGSNDFGNQHIEFLHGSGTLDDPSLFRNATSLGTGATTAAAALALIDDARKVGGLIELYTHGTGANPTFMDPVEHATLYAGLRTRADADSKFILLGYDEAALKITGKSTPATASGYTTEVDGGLAVPPDYRYGRRRR